MYMHDARHTSSLRNLSEPAPRPPECTLDLAARYEDGTLDLEFALATLAQPLNWNVWLAADSQATQLWSILVRQRDAPRHLTVSIPAFPQRETVGLLTSLTTPSGDGTQEGIPCSGTVKLTGLSAYPALLTVSKLLILGSSVNGFRPENARILLNLTVLGRHLLKATHHRMLRDRAFTNWFQGLNLPRLASPFFSLSCLAVSANIFASRIEGIAVAGQQRFARRP